MTDTINHLPNGSIESMIDAGWLTPAVFYAPPMENYNFSVGTGHRFVAPYTKYCAGKRAIVFCNSVEHCEMVTAEFVRHGIPAAAVLASQNKGERTANLERFEAGSLMVLTTCNVLIDSCMPEVDAIIIATPTDSRGRFHKFVAAGLQPRIEQQRGRNLPIDSRIGNESRADYDDRQIQKCIERRKALIAASSKPRAIILDMVGNVLRHGPIGDCPPVTPPKPEPVEMVGMRTTELTGPALRYAVSSAEGLLEQLRWCWTEDGAKIQNMWTDDHGCWDPLDWEIGGPLLTKYAIAFAGRPGGAEGNGTWLAYFSDGPNAWEAYGDTHLLAACRAIVLRHLGAIVQIPADIAAASGWKA